jgi:hypothetical protein
MGSTLVREVVTMLTIVRKWLEALPTRPAIAILILLAGPAGVLATFSESLGVLLTSLANVAVEVQYRGIARQYVSRRGDQFLRLSYGGYWIQTTEGLQIPGTLPDRGAGDDTESCQLRGASSRSALQEIRKDEAFVYLYDFSRASQNDPTNPLLIRIPLEGGIAQCSYANPIVWKDLFEVSGK